MNYRSVVNFTVFTANLWELVTGSWTIRYSQKTMEQRSQDLGKADKGSSSSPAALELFLLWGS